MTFVLPVMWAVAAATAVDALTGALRDPGRKRLSGRRLVLRRFAELPDFMELLALALSCGQPLTAAWASAAHFMPAGPLRTELERASTALARGRPADRCMTDLADRVGDSRAAMALALIAQAFTMGNAVEASLLSQAAALRRLRMTDVERRAQTAPLRMMLPVMLLIFPAVMAVLLGPVILRLTHGGPMF